MNVSYQGNQQDMLMNVQIPYVNATATMKNKKTLNATVAVSNGSIIHQMVKELNYYLT